MPPNIRVCAFTHFFHPHFTGAGLYALTLAKEFSKRGVEFIFVTVDNSGLPREDEFEGFKVYRISDGPKKHGEFVLWWNLWRVLWSLKDRFDIIHAFGSTYRNSAVGLIGKTLNKKVLTTVSMAHNDLHPMTMGGVSGRLQTFFLRFVDRYISLSRDITEEIRGLPLDFHKAREIPQGVDTRRFTPATGEEKLALRDRLRLPNGPLALYVGVMDGRKNVKWLVETWAKNRILFSGWRLLLVGPASRDEPEAGLREALRVYARVQGLSEIILFRDFTPKIEDYFRAADLFILPSVNEGMPNALVEAMGCGIPSLVTRISGTADLVTDGVSGKLFEVSDEDGFIAGMKILISDDSVRARLGNAARSLVEKRLSTEHVSARYFTLYNELLERNH